MRGVISAREPCSLNRPFREHDCARITICYYGSQVDQKSVHLSVSLLCAVKVKKTPFKQAEQDLRL